MNTKAGPAMLYSFSPYALLAQQRAEQLQQSARRCFFVRALGALAHVRQELYEVSRIGKTGAGLSYAQRKGPLRYAPRRAQRKQNPQVFR